jgi:hypothetical protein
MKRFLFVFGYESPEDARANAGGDDAESSNAVWVEASSEEEAMEKGRAYAETFVAIRHAKAGATKIPSWRAGNFAHWIARRPLDEFSGQALDLFERI